MSSGSSKNVIYKMCLQIIYSIYIYKGDVLLNNQQWLICHKTIPNQTKSYVLLTLNNQQWLTCHKTKPNQIICTFGIK